MTELNMAITSLMIISFALGWYANSRYSTKEIEIHLAAKISEQDWNKVVSEIRRQINEED